MGILIKTKILFLFLLMVGFLTSGCSDVKFETIDVAGKASRDQNEEVPDPDLPPDTPNPPPPEEPPTPPEEPPVPPEEPPDTPEEPETGNQVFRQNNGGGKVDILIVIDNSDSMMMDHANHRIRKMFRGFLGSLENVDYQIGFVTTDMTTTSFPASNPLYPGWTGRLDNLEGTRQKVLTPGTANKDSLFLQTIDREESIDCRDGVRKDDPAAPCGTNKEEPLKAIMSAVSQKDSYNAGFFRSDADLVSIIVSDEDERSEGKDPQTTTAEQVVNHIANKLGNQKNYTNYSVVIEPGDKECKRIQACAEPFCLGGGNYGDFATRLSNITSGRTASICSSNVTSQLADIGNRGREGGLFDKVTLQYEPIEGSVQVSFNPDANIGFTVEGRDVKFDSKPAAGTEIQVVYEYRK